MPPFASRGAISPLSAADSHQGAKERQGRRPTRARRRWTTCLDIGRSAVTGIGSCGAGICRLASYRPQNASGRNLRRRGANQDRPAVECFVVAINRTTSGCSRMSAGCSSSWRGSHTSSKSKFATYSPSRFVIQGFEPCMFRNCGYLRWYVMDSAWCRDSYSRPTCALESVDPVINEQELHFQYSLGKNAAHRLREVMSQDKPKESRPRPPRRTIEQTRKALEDAHERSRVDSVPNPPSPTPQYT